MNNAKPAAQWLFLDLNAFFASCEQQEAPVLRGKPVIVREARRLCPNVIPVQANHRLYPAFR
jgi:nucleotidyltransferase/DNA polymerase involved in DNA repair